MASERVYVFCFGGGKEGGGESSAYIALNVAIHHSFYSMIFHNETFNFRTHWHFLRQHQPRSTSSHCRRKMSISVIISSRCRTRLIIYTVYTIWQQCSYVYQTAKSGTLMEKIKAIFHSIQNKHRDILIYLNLICWHQANLCVYGIQSTYRFMACFRST